MMNKLIFLSILFLSIISCKNESKTTDTPATPEKKEVDLGLPVPELKDVKAQDFVKDYDKMILDYNAAYQSNDSAAMAKIIPNIDLKTREGMELVPTLDSTDSKKAGEYFQSKVNYLISLRTNK